MSTPPYVPPYIGPAGLVVNGYPSILADNLQKFLNIYGQNQFVGPSSAIYQLLSVLSLKQADVNAALQLAYNQSSPQTAVGAGLDRQVKMNGLARSPYTYSTATLSLTGTPNATITGAAAQDQNGNLWSLPSPFTFSSVGTFSALATCTTPGNVTAEPGTISIVATPQIGWTPPSGTVTNAAAAVAGLPVEEDSGLRARQAVSVSLPSTTPVSATIAAILAVSGVTRVAPGQPTSGGPGTSVENPTGATDSWGNPAHSISMVVEGGLNSDVALAIYTKRTLGCYTNGTTAVVVADPVTGFLNTMRFYQPSYLVVYALVQLTGYGSTPTSAVVAAVQAALTAYLNELAIGETVSLSALIYEAMAVNTSLPSPSFGVASLAIGTATYTVSATTTLGSTAMTLAASGAVAIGQLVTSPAVALGTTVAAVTGTAVTLSANAIASGSNSTVFSTLTAADLTMPNFYSVARGVASNVAVLA